MFKYVVETEIAVHQQTLCFPGLGDCFNSLVSILLPVHRACTQRRFCPRRVCLPFGDLQALLLSPTSLDVCVFCSKRVICHIEMGKNGRVIRDRQGNSVNSGTMHWFENQCKSANSERGRWRGGREGAYWSIFQPSTGDGCKEKRSSDRSESGSGINNGCAEKLCQ